jgi:hypothetical protein
MARRFEDRGFDEEETMEQDPLGEDGFEAQGFDDAPNGGPRFGAPELDDEAPDRRPGRLPQKMAGIPRSEQHRTNTPSRDRPDSSGIVVRERGGLSKGDPAVGGTRPD